MLLGFLALGTSSGTLHGHVKSKISIKDVLHLRHTVQPTVAISPDLAVGTEQYAVIEAIEVKKRDI
jgi:hypothetical protein